MCVLWTIFDSKTFTQFRILLMNIYFVYILGRYDVMWCDLSYSTFYVLNMALLRISSSFCFYLQFSRLDCSLHSSNNIENRMSHILTWLLFTNSNWRWTMFFSVYFFFLFFFVLFSTQKRGRQRGRKGDIHTRTHTHSPSKYIFSRREISMSQNFACTNYVKWNNCRQW